MAKKASKSTGSLYTQPELRQQLKEQLQAGAKGGKPGQWSARKSQLLAQQYKAEGGGYTGDKGAPQKSLDRWTDEQWTTSDGKKAQKGDSTDRYLPKEAWENLSDAQKQKTRAPKQAGSKAGKQYVSNTAAAKKSRKKASKKTVVSKPAANKKVTQKATAPKARPQKATDTKAPSRKTASKKEVPKKAVSKKTAPKKAASKKAASEKAASKKTASKKTPKKSTANKKVASRQKAGRPRSKRS
jgi:hypothetical protein